MQEAQQLRQAVARTLLRHIGPEKQAKATACRRFEICSKSQQQGTNLVAGDGERYIILQDSECTKQADMQLKHNLQVSSQLRC